MIITPVQLVPGKIPIFHINGIDFLYLVSTMLRSVINTEVVLFSLKCSSSLVGDDVFIFIVDKLLYTRIISSH